MNTGHREIAEQILKDVAWDIDDPAQMQAAGLMIAIAQVHATLAAAPNHQAIANRPQNGEKS